ncbi:MAG TPA: winged helix-turn-helix transcriptional regulator [Flexilinea sp.]|nr:winged helix-turn-helix transcriptional regulator [Flexilinea sp.]
MTYETAYDSKDLDILKLLTENPQLSQAEIGKRLGVAVGTVNWRLKRLVSDGFLRTVPGEGRKLNYFVTESGTALSRQLYTEFVDRSFSAYRTIKKQMQDLLDRCEADHFTTIQVYGDGDAAEICRLIAVSRGLKIVSSGGEQDPIISVNGLQISINFPEKKASAQPLDGRNKENQDD